MNVIHKYTGRVLGTLIRETRFFLLWQPNSGAPAVKESRFTGSVEVEQLAPVVNFPGNPTNKTTH